MHFRWSFEREARWLMLLVVVLPLIAFALVVVVPALLRHWAR